MEGGREGEREERRAGSEGRLTTGPLAAWRGSIDKRRRHGRERRQGRSGEGGRGRLGAASSKAVRDTKTDDQEDDESQEQNRYTHNDLDLEVLAPHV
jgi:hypothetical protein